MRLVAGGTHATTKALDCPFCAHSEVVVVEVEPEARVFAVRCSECGTRVRGR